MKTFEIPGAPVGKARPKFTSVNGFARAYTPKKTQSYENLVKLFYTMKYGNKAPSPNPISVAIVAYFQVPASSTKKFKEMCAAGNVPVTKKPDADNIAKIICDSLNEIAFKDDSQIFDLSCKKLYSENPRTEVVIRELS